MTSRSSHTPQRISFAEAVLGMITTSARERAIPTRERTDSAIMKGGRQEDPREWYVSVPGETLKYDSW